MKKRLSLTLAALLAAAPAAAVSRISSAAEASCFLLLFIGSSQDDGPAPAGRRAEGHGQPALPEATALLPIPSLAERLPL